MVSTQHFCFPKMREKGMQNFDHRTTLTRNIICIFHLRFKQTLKLYTNVKLERERERDYHYLADANFEGKKHCTECRLTIATTEGNSRNDTRAN